MQDLRGSVVLVTGASGGLGGGPACLPLWMKAAIVVLLARRKDELERVAEIIRAKGRQAGPSIPPPSPP